MLKTAGLFLSVLINFCAFHALAQDDSCQDGCKHKIEYCDAYESKCQPCEAICLPPTNPKFSDCAKSCSAFLQDLLIQKFNEPNDTSKLDTIQALVIIVTCVSILSLVIIMAFVIHNIMERSSKKARTDVMPLYQYDTGTNTIRTLSTNVSDTNNGFSSRIPVEDRAPSEVGYDNPVMNPSPSRH